jgi:hypothetical protein
MRLPWETDAPVTVGWIQQFRYFERMFNKISNVPGDVVECGVGRGLSFAMLAYLTGNENSQSPRVLWGFDSFQGWPEPTVYDQSQRNPQKGEWLASEAQVWKWLEQSLIFQEFPNLTVQIVPGFFGETLPTFPDRNIAFLHIDADLYTSYRDALIYLFPKVALGGIVLFDECREFPPGYGGLEKWPGATKAIDDYFAPLSYPLTLTDFLEGKGVKGLTAAAGEAILGPQLGRVCHLPLGGAPPIDSRESPFSLAGSSTRGHTALLAWLVSCCSDTVRMLFKAWITRSGPKRPEVRTTWQRVNRGMTSSLFGAGREEV